MNEQGAVQDGLSDVSLPEEDEPVAAGLHHMQRDQPQRVVEQMHGDIGEKDIARPETKPADHRSTTSKAAGSLQVAGRWQRFCRRRRWAVAAGSDGSRSLLRYRAS